MLSLSENIKLAFRNIRANLMRAILTMFIIGIGITALVGILTALDCLLYSLSDSFNTLEPTPFPSNANGKRRAATVAEDGPNPLNPSVTTRRCPSRKDSIFLPK
jgi:ABC-type antimicrobial peptide transport system permease subunit